MIQFYVDTCIWMNLFKKEGTGSYPYWKIAEDFIESTNKFSQNKILLSSFVLKELFYQLGKQNFEEKVGFLKKICTLVKGTEEDYLFAQKLEEESLYELSHYDCLHIAICKRLGFILVTRDSALLNFAQKYIIAEIPENLFY